MSIELNKSAEELRHAFYALNTREDIANLLEVDDSKLRYYLYLQDNSKRYSVFRIPKKSGGERVISAPISSIKIIQRKLNQILQSVYEPKPSVHGFVQGRSIRTNARIHARRRYVLNIDLKEFFPSINFGRVRGLFMGNPYYRNEEVATVLAQICCFDNQLPQGAPTSPVVSNMICTRLDAKLQQLAKKHRSTYTRYADDITFSTTQVNFPSALAYINEEGETLIGGELLEIISDNHFEVNSKKVRLQARNKRQEVTGLTVNRFPNVQRKYISQIRGMLFAWRKFGLETTQARYLQFYNRRHRNPDYPPPDFRKVVQGKIEFVGMIRGKNNPIYMDLCNRLWKLAPELAKRDDSNETNDNIHGVPAQKALVITEGKTDWKHLKSALTSLKQQELFSNLDIIFQEEENPKEAGAAWLLRTCKSLSTVQQPLPTICIFDRDIEGNKKKVTDEVGDYKDWGNNVHSFLLPIPKYRQTTPDISIEFLYCDEDLQRIDENGRRLFLSNEFNQLSGRHLTLDLVCTDRHKLQSPSVKVIDNDVYDRESKSVALSKNDFADHILNCDPGFTNFDVSEFAKVFDMIKEIVTNGDI